MGCTFERVEPTASSARRNVPCVQVAKHQRLADLDPAIERERKRDEEQEFGIFR